MKRASAGKPAADWLWCLGRARGTQTLLVLITLCIVFITVQVPQFIGPSILPQINAPLDAIEEGLIAGLGRSRYHHHHQEQFQNTEPHQQQQQQQQQRKLIANEWNEKPGQSSSDGDDHLLPGSAPSKHKTASQVDNDYKTSHNRGGGGHDSASLAQAWEKKGPKLGLQSSHKMEDEKVALQQQSDALPLQMVVDQAWRAGASAWQELEEVLVSKGDESVKAYGSIITTSCPYSISMNGKQLEDAHRGISLPCGLIFGSSIVLIGTPRYAHSEYKPPIARVGDGESQYVMVSQFGLELHGVKEEDGEDAPRILHLNPRLRGDWSLKPVIEHNTCYQGKWGSGQRCEGWAAAQDEETVDGQLKCEAWLEEDDDEKPGESERSWWLSSFMGRSEKGTLEWRYPFSEGHLFILNLRAGADGFHLSVDGRHISSFPYAGFVVEEVTGFSLYGDVDVHSVTINALPPMHPSYVPELVLEQGRTWKAPWYPTEEIDLFVGVMSSSNHFSERMAVRKTWFQSHLIQSSKVVARFFVALHADKNINLQVRKEANFYGDMIILPFIDRYDIVVLKTVAICEFGIHNVTAKYIMKTDDDTFVRVDKVLAEIKATSVGQGLYMGSMNEFHRPLRTGKWAVTFEEWPERIYPTYANGPGYILSKDIAQYIVSQSKANTLRLFKMEDVSVGLWVGQYGREKHVQYENSARFSQAGCVSDYLTAHYQSPRQMMCLWDTLLTTGVAKCC